MLHRLRQAVALVTIRDAGPPPEALAWTPRTGRLFVDLAPHDQRHLAAVHVTCLAEGLSPDVAVAGLLHDIGKASLSGRRVSLVDRSSRVILRRVAPQLSKRKGRESWPGWRIGLALADGHATLGANRLAALGWPTAVVAAVRDHELPDATGDLGRLREIDDATA